MTETSYTVCIIVPLAFKANANALGYALRYDDPPADNFSVPLGSGQNQTHWGSSITGASQAFVDLLAAGKAGQMPPGLEAFLPVVQAMIYVAHVGAKDNALRDLATANGLLIVAVEP